jgi:endoglucanase
MQRRNFLALSSALGMMVPLAASAASLVSQGLQGTALDKAWDSYARQFVQADGRVVDTGNQGITHTEGLGVSMLVAQACDDRVRFDKMWRFCRTNLRRPDGLYSWKWVPGKGVADANNATDGDIYIAWALYRAGVRWNDKELLSAAGDLAKAIRTNCLVVSPRGRVLLPGVNGFIVKSATGVDRAVVNPSYWVFPAFKDLMKVDLSPVWGELYRDGLALLEAAHYGSQDLPSDWLILDDPVAPWRERPARFGYEAIRVPLFLSWAQKAQHPTLRACAKFMQQPGFPAWVGLDGTEKANYAAPSGFEAVARLVRRGVYGTPYVAPALSGDYFSSSLVLLSLLAASDLGWA